MILLETIGAERVFTNQQIPKMESQTADNVLPFESAIINIIEYQQAVNDIAGENRIGV